MSFLFFFLFAASYRAACFCLYLLDTLFGTFFFLRFPALLYIYIYIYIYMYVGALYTPLFSKPPRAALLEQHVGGVLFPFLFSFFLEFRGG